MARETILVVDDEPEILQLVEFNLAKNGFRTVGVGTGEAALEKANKLKPDLMVLDLMLPGVDGLEVCRLLKGDEKTRDIPVVMLTAKGEEADIVAGLELGADDYVTKPFSPRVLLARIKAVLRRRTETVPADDSSVKAGEIVIIPGRHEVLARGKKVELTDTEFKILHFLARRPGWVFTRYQIVDGTQGQEVSVTERSVDVHIVAVRKKLGDCGEYIETVRGVGYRFKEE